MKVTSQALALLIFTASHGLIDASGLRSKNARNPQEGSEYPEVSEISETKRRNRHTETIGGVKVTTNEDETEPEEKIYVFQAKEENDRGNGREKRRNDRGNGAENNACATLQGSGVNPNDCTYLESLGIGYFKAPKGKKTVEEALTRGDFGKYVESVESDQVVQAVEVYNTNLWNLDFADGTYGDNQYEYDTVDASSVVLAIIDTGIYFDHFQFDKVQRYPGKSFVANTNVWTDENGHGTHVAGSAVGQSVGVGMGLENVSLTAVKVLDASGMGSMSGVLGGLDWVANEADNNPSKKYVANMSLGAGFSSMMNSAVNNLADRSNVEIVVAAGNSNNDACNYSPAPASGAITVGSVTYYEQYNYQVRSSFSNYGSCVDIYAPGSSILSSYNQGRFTYAWLSGTSMAAPHVAGAVAIEKAKGMTYKQNCVNDSTSVCLSTK